MKATPRNIWAVPANLRGVQLPPTEDVAIAAEKAIGFPLPPEYAELLRVQNGGYIRFTLPDTEHESIAGVGSRYNALSVVDDLDEALVPFDGDGHWYLCLDYRVDCETPAVTLIDSSFDSERIIGQTFAEYLDALVIDTSDTLVAHSVPDVPTLISALKKTLDVQFDDCCVDVGFPLYRARLASAGRDDWFSLSPNEANLTYSVINDSFEEEYSHKKGTGLRYPELPAQSILLTYVGDSAASLLEASGNEGLTIVEMASFYSGTEIG